MIWARLNRVTLTQWIIFAMIAGVIIGWQWPALGESLKPLSTVFLRMIRSIIVPILFSTLVVGIAGHGDDMKRVGRLALKSLIYFEIVSTLALLIGFAAFRHFPRYGIALRKSRHCHVQANEANCSHRHSKPFAHSMLHAHTGKLSCLRGPWKTSTEPCSPCLPTVSRGRVRPWHLHLVRARAPCNGHSSRLRERARCRRWAAGGRAAG